MRHNMGLLAIALMLSSSAHAQSIGIFLDEEGTRCNGHVGDLPIVTLHVLALPGGSIGDLAAAQFRIVGAPDTWTPENAIWLPNPDAPVAIGNPLFTHTRIDGGPGFITAFKTCSSEQDPTNPSAPLSLGRLLVVQAPTPENTVLRIEKWQLFPDEDCPLFVRCDRDDFAKACVAGGELTLNGDGAGCGSVTAIQRATWSTVRVLYK